MKRLSQQISLLLISDFGSEEYLRRLSDPYWFQAFGCVLGFDWHSSGLSTTVCGAIKAGLEGLEGELGVFVAGGKGKNSRRTPLEITGFGERFGIEVQSLIYASKMPAKVDNTALQDGYRLYHHLFLFTKEGRWAVIQQGMNPDNRWARRYHWFSLAVRNFVCEPHSAICCDHRQKALNMVALESGEAREMSTSASIRGARVFLTDRESCDILIINMNTLYTMISHSGRKEDWDDRQGAS